MAIEAYPPTFMLFCRQVLATDFKAMHRVQLDEAPQLLEFAESGEFKVAVWSSRSGVVQALSVTLLMQRNAKAISRPVE